MTIDKQNSDENNINLDQNRLKNDLTTEINPWIVATCLVFAAAFAVCTIVWQTQLLKHFAEEITRRTELVNLQTSVSCAKLNLTELYNR